MGPSSQAGAAIALVVYIVGLALAFGLRTWQQYRRTGDTGIRRIASDSSATGRWGAVLFVIAVVLGVVGPLLALLHPSFTLTTTSLVWWVGFGLGLAGTALALLSQQAMGASWRIGVDPGERTALVTTGPFATMRNPIFTAMALAMAGVMVMTPNPASLAALVALVVGIELQVRAVEEPYLRQVHGHDYLAYASHAGRFVPGIGRLRKATTID